MSSGTAIKPNQSPSIIPTPVNNADYTPGWGISLGLLICCLVFYVILFYKDYLKEYKGLWMGLCAIIGASAGSLTYFSLLSFRTDLVYLDDCKCQPSELTALTCFACVCLWLGLVCIGGGGYISNYGITNNLKEVFTTFENPKPWINRTYNSIHSSINVLYFMIVVLVLAVASISAPIGFKLQEKDCPSESQKCLNKYETLWIQTKTLFPTIGSGILICLMCGLLIRLLSTKEVVIDLTISKPQLVTQSSPTRLAPSLPPASPGTISVEYI